jgi:hypothetical protein
VEFISGSDVFAVPHDQFFFHVPAVRGVLLVCRQDSAWLRFILPADKEISGSEYKSGENYGEIYNLSSMYDGK